MTTSNDPDMTHRAEPEHVTHPTEPPPASPYGATHDRSLGDLFSQLTSDFSLLVRQEVALAKAELKETASRGGQGAGMLTGAAIAGGFVLLFLSMALMWALGTTMHLGWAAVIVAVVWAVVAAVLALLGKKRLESVRGMPRTAETVKDIPPTMKPGDQTP